MNDTTSVRARPCAGRMARSLLRWALGLGALLAVLLAWGRPAAADNDPAPAEVSVALAGAYSYTAAATLPAGQVTVTLDRDNAVRSVLGAGTVGGATVTFDVRRVLWFRAYSGAVTVADPAAGISARVPVLFTPLTRLDPRGAAGAQQWFVFRNWRIVPYTLTWSVAHPASVPDTTPPQGRPEAGA